MRTIYMPIFFLVSFFLFAQERTSPKSQPVELGEISWYRDFDLAKSMAEKERKPIFILFQEVPGCSTCRTYGKNVLSNPTLTSAIEKISFPWLFLITKGEKIEKH